MHIQTDSVVVIEYSDHVRIRSMCMPMTMRSVPQTDVVAIPKADVRAVRDALTAWLKENT